MPLPVPTTLISAAALRVFWSHYEALACFAIVPFIWDATTTCCAGQAAGRMWYFGEVIGFLIAGNAKQEAPLLMHEPTLLQSFFFIDIPRFASTGKQTLSVRKQCGVQSDATECFSFLLMQCLRYPTVSLLTYCKKKWWLSLPTFFFDKKQATHFRNIQSNLFLVFRFTNDKITMVIFHLLLALLRTAQPRSSQNCFHHPSLCIGKKKPPCLNELGSEEGREGSPRETSISLYFTRRFP